MKYKVAVATSDGKTVDSHFGHVSNFLIFEVDEESGKFEDIEDRDVKAACSGGTCAGGEAQNASSGEASSDCGSGTGCGGHNGAAEGASQMDEIAAALSDVDYVLCARIGPHAIRALARKNITAYDIVLPIDEGILKINEFRKKIKERKAKYTSTD